MCASAVAVAAGIHIKYPSVVILMIQGEAFEVDNRLKTCVLIDYEQEYIIQQSLATQIGPRSCSRCVWFEVILRNRVMEKNLKEVRAELEIKYTS